MRGHMLRIAAAGMLLFVTLSVTLPTDANQGRGSE